MPANAPPPVSARARVALFPFSLPSEEGNGAPGGARALRYGALVGLRCVIPDTPARLARGGIASPVPRRARAVISRLAKPRHRTAAPPRAPLRTALSAAAAGPL